MFDWVDTMRFSGQRVGVAFGGRKAEREISLRTGRALIEALQHKGYEVRGYDLPGDLHALITDPPAALLLGLHGDGEDGTIQGLLEVCQIPYTGSGLLASALCMDKGKARAVMAAAGVPLARGLQIDPAQLAGEAFGQVLESHPWHRAGYVLKPTDSGSSHGVHVLAGDADPDEALEDLRQILDEGLATGVLLEERLSGPEFSVGFFGEVCLGAIQITPESAFYDYHAKYEAQTTRYEPIDGEEAEAVMAVATQAWRALGCRGVGRVDVMAHQGEGGERAYYVLEANTIPGMTATSLVPKLAARKGVSFDDFAELMLCSATTDAALASARRVVLPASEETPGVMLPVSEPVVEEEKKR